MNEQAPSKVAPDAEELGAGDDVVIFDEEGVIADSGVLCDVDGDDAEVRIGRALIKVVPLGWSPTRTHRRRRPPGLYP